MPKQLDRETLDKKTWEKLGNNTVDELLGVSVHSGPFAAGEEKATLETSELRRLMIESPDEMKQLYNFCISYLTLFFRFDKTPKGLVLLKLQPLSCLSLKIFEEYKAKIGDIMDAIRDFPAVLEVFFKDYGLNSAILEYFLRRLSSRDMIRRYLKFHYVLPARKAMVLEKVAQAETMEALRCWCRISEKLLREMNELQGSLWLDSSEISNIGEFLESKAYPLLDYRVQMFLADCSELKGIARDINDDCDSRKLRLCLEDPSSLSSKSIRDRVG